MSKNSCGVTPASKTSIQISFQYGGVRYREIIPLIPTPKNLEVAQQKRSVILRTIKDGTFEYAAHFPNSPRVKKHITTSGHTEQISNYLTHWLRSQKAVLKASSYEGYRKIVDNLIVPQFGDLLLPQLKRRAIKEWLETMPCGNKRLINIQSVLRKALSDAVDDELLDINCMTNYCYQRKARVKEVDDIDPFTLAEQTSILAIADPQLRHQLQFAFWTGVRTSELIALNWADIDFDRNLINIRRAITQAAKGVAETTKTMAGRRQIKILAPALEALLSQRQYTANQGEAIFINPRTNQRWTGDKPIRDIWAQLLKTACVRYRWPYQTRHTYASMMLSAGENPMWVAKQMGHRDWTMIAKVYGKWMPDANSQAGEKAEATFGTQVVRNRLIALHSTQ